MIRKYRKKQLQKPKKTDQRKPKSDHTSERTHLAVVVTQKTRKKKSMPFREHLRELRRRIIYVAVAYVVFVIACFIFVQEIVVVMLSMADAFVFVYLSPSELIMCYMRLSLIFALAALSPFIGYHIWAFAVPALKKREKRVVLMCLLAGFFFFLLGVLFSFEIVLPFTITFLAGFNNLEIISANISVDSYTRFILNMLMVFGLVFEMPVLSSLLSMLGVLKPKLLKKARKYALIIIFIIAAVITPPDVVSQVMVAVPMLFLYQLSTWICQFVAWRKKKKAEEDEDEDEDEDDDEDEDEVGDNVGIASIND